VSAEPAGVGDCCERSGPHRGHRRQIAGAFAGDRCCGERVGARKVSCASLISCPRLSKLTAERAAEGALMRNDISNVALGGLLAICVLTLGVLSLLFFSFRHNKSNLTQDTKSVETIVPRNEPSPLSANDSARIQEIMANVTGDPNFLTPSIRSEFWTLLRKGQFSQKEIEETRKINEVFATVYMKLLNEDALIALKTRCTYKSNEREEVEGLLLKSKVFNQWRVRENERLIEKIAAREPIQIGENKIVMDEARINRSLQDLATVSNRLTQLFTEPAP